MSFLIGGYHVRSLSLIDRCNQNFYNIILKYYVPVIELIDFQSPVPALWGRRGFCEKGARLNP